MAPSICKPTGAKFKAAVPTLMLRRAPPRLIGLAIVAAPELIRALVPRAVAEGFTATPLWAVLPSKRIAPVPAMLPELDSPVLSVNTLVTLARLPNDSVFAPRLHWPEAPTTT